MEQLRKIVKEAEATRIAQRAILEREIKDMKERLSTVDPSTIQELEIDLEKLECKKVFPSLYEENFELTTYDKEAECFEVVLKRIDALRDKLIEEAMRELAAS